MKYGFMDVDRWFREGHREKGERVLCDGKNITDDCIWFNDETGEAECYVAPRNLGPDLGLDKYKLRGVITVVEAVKP